MRQRLDGPLRIRGRRLPGCVHRRSLSVAQADDRVQATVEAEQVPTLRIPKETTRGIGRRWFPRRAECSDAVTLV